MLLCGMHVIISAEESSTEEGQIGIISFQTTREYRCDVSSSKCRPNLHYTHPLHTVMYCISVLNQSKLDRNTLITVQIASYSQGCYSGIKENGSSLPYVLCAGLYNPPTSYYNPE